MSWIVSAVGTAMAVAAKLEKDFANINCTEPEQTIAKAVAATIATSLGAMPPTFPVRVDASGSQSKINHSDPASPAINQLKVEIAPIWNYQE